VPAIRDRPASDPRVLTFQPSCSPCKATSKEAPTPAVVPSSQRPRRSQPQSTKGETWPYWQPQLRPLRYWPCVTTGGLNDP
jgi:hypothetical protein